MSRNQSKSKYISIFFLILMANVVLFYLLGGLFDGGEYVEAAVYTFSTIIIILLSVVISLLYYLIDLVKKRMKML